MGFLIGLILASAITGAPHHHRHHDSLFETQLWAMQHVVMIGDAAPGQFDERFGGCGIAGEPACDNRPVVHAPFQPSEPAQVPPSPTPLTWHDLPICHEVREENGMIALACDDGRVVRLPQYTDPYAVVR